MRFLLLTSALVPLLATPAWAQSAAPTSTEVVITARKKAEPLVRAPLSVAVVTGERMQKLQAHDLKDLQALTPSLIITSTANEAQTTARLRGIGTVGDNPGLDSSVGVVIDGVTRARTATAMADLGAVERIEVLKGPQSDVFGKGASAGVIQVITKAPSFTKQSDYEFTLGERGTAGVQAYLTGPLTQTVAGSISITRRERDGQYKVKTGNGPRTAKEDNDQNYIALRGQLLFVPSEALSVRVIADYARRDEMCCTGTAIQVGSTRAWIDALAPDEGTAAVPDPESRQAWSNRSTHQDIVDTGVSVQADWTISDALSLTSITSARHWNHTNGYDADFSSADVYFRYPDGGFGNRFDTLSQEVRLSGSNGPIDWMLGLYLDREELIRNDQTRFGSAYETYVSLVLSGGAFPNRVSTYTGLPVGTSFVLGQGLQDRHEQVTTNAALFGSATWTITNTLSVTAALRHNRQDKELVSRYTNTDGGKACAAARTHSGLGLSVLCQSFSNNAFNNLTNTQSDAESISTGSLRVRWQVTPTLMTYASYAEGWKGAGFNLDREQTSTYAADLDTSFKSERSRSYEVGAKGRFGALALDFAVFDSHFRNFQLNTFLGTTFLVTAIPNLSSKGAELEARWQPVEGLSLWSGVTYADTKFGPEIVPGLALIPNNTASFAPEWSGTYGADYTRPIGGLKLNATLSARYNSDYNTGSDLAPIKLQRAFTLYNGQIAIGSPDDLWSLSLWGTNLSDELYHQVVFSAPFQSGTFMSFVGQPRTVGLTLRLKR